MRCVFISCVLFFFLFCAGDVKMSVAVDPFTWIKDEKSIVFNKPTRIGIQSKMSGFCVRSVDDVLFGSLHHSHSHYSVTVLYYPSIKQ